MDRLGGIPSTKEADVTTSDDAVKCSVCGDEIPPARLELWPWARTCSPPHSSLHEASTQRRHRRDYRKRRAAKVRAERAALRRDTDKHAGGTE